MQVSKNNLENSVLEIVFILDKSDVNPFIKKASENLSANLKMDGFRPGKVPGEIAAKQFGDDTVFEEAVTLFIKDFYPTYIKENEIEVVSQPEVNITKIVTNKEAECKIKVQIIPSIELKGYKEKAKQILKEKKEVLVKDEEIESTLKWLCESRAEFKEIDSSLKEGDIADINYDVIIDGEKNHDLSKENYKFIVGKEPVFQSFNEALMGLKKGEEKEIEITFPEDYSLKEFQGKKAAAKITLNKILKKEVPEVTDEFAKRLGEKFENAEQLKTNIKEGIKKEKEIKEEERIRLLILEKIREDLSVELPEILVERETNNTLEEVKHRIAEMGMEFNDYLAQIKKTEEDIKKDISAEAKNKVMNALVLREIIKLEKIEPTDKEIEERAQMILNEISLQNPDAKNIDINIIRNYSAEIIRNEKVFALLTKED